MKVSTKLSGSGIVRLVTISVLVFGTTSCHKPAPGNLGRPIDVYRSTVADVAPPRAIAHELWVFSDQVAEALVRDLVDIDQIRSYSTRAILELDDLHNRTNTSTTDFEAIQGRIRSKLMKSKIIRDHFMIVAAPYRMDHEKGHVVGKGNTATSRYASNITYMLMGNFFESRHGSMRRYYFEFTLVNLASHEIVFHNDYDLVQ